MIEMLSKIWNNFSDYEKATLIIMTLQLIVALITVLLVL